MNCVSCKNTLKKLITGNLELEICDHCSGTWFQKDELRLAKDQADPELRWLDSDFFANSKNFNIRAGNRDCPQCNSQMVELEYNNTGILIDSCQKCEGIWLDGGEFEKIVGQLKTLAATQDVPELMKASLQEAREIFTGPESKISEWKDFTIVISLLGRRIFVENPTLCHAILNLQRTL